MFERYRFFYKLSVVWSLYIIARKYFFYFTGEYFFKIVKKKFLVDI